MKKNTLLILMLLLTASLLFSCGDAKAPFETDAVSDTETVALTESEAPETEKKEPIIENIKKLTLIRSENAGDIEKSLVDVLHSTIGAETGSRPSVATDLSSESENEIIVGETSRAATERAKALISGSLDYVIKADGGSIVILGGSDIGTMNALYFFIDNFIRDGKVYIPEEEVIYHDESNIESIYAKTVATPNRYTRYKNNLGDEIYGAQHLQGMTMDDEGNVYFSFTGLIVKVNQNGEEVGVYKVSDELISLSTHIGNLYWHEGKIYIGLGISKTSLSKHKRYIGVLDDSVFDGGYVQDNEENPLLYGINIAELSVDRTFTNSEGKAVARFGGGGIDGITVGKLPGGGYILPAGYKVKEAFTSCDGEEYAAGDILTKDVEVTDEKDYIIAVRTQGSYDAFRYDDDNQQIMVFDFDDITEENLLPLTYERITNDDPTTIDIKFNIFLYCGYHTYGTQVICYDKDTGDYQLWTYGRSEKNNEFPKDSLTVIDGSKKLYMAEVEIGQSVSEDSEHYRIAREYAENYYDANDLDNDGDRSEALLGWHATMKCVCDAGGLENHEEVIYGETGHPTKICGINTTLQGDNGCISLGNGFFYIAAQSNDEGYFREDGTTAQKAYGAQARLYYLNRNGGWKFMRIKSW
ncbi:MAG: hypothetical protein IKJ91_11740 [Clostridia bacterium]|nr:hypothetical protein [Clostridia bacterium]